MNSWKIILHLLRLEWKLTVRNWLFKEEELVNSIISIGIFLYISGTLLYAGSALSKIINERSLALFVIIYFLIEFIARLFFQGAKFPMQLIYYPIYRSVLSHFILLRTLINSFNILPLLLFLPIILSMSESVAWTILVIFFILLSNLVLTLIRLIEGVSIALFVGLVLTAVMFVLILGAPDFSFITPRPERYFVLFTSIALLCCFLYTINYWMIKSRLFLDSVNSTTFYPLATFPYNISLGKNNALLCLELKLIIRNKRPLYYFLIILFQFLLLYAYNDIIPQNFKLIYWVFSSTLLMTVYGQFLFSWEGEFFQYLIIYSDPASYIKAKQHILYAIGLVNIVCLFPMALQKHEIIYWLCSSSFSLGISSLIILAVGMNNRTRMKLDQKAFFNYQGVSTITWIIVPLVLVIPELIILPFQFFNQEKVGVVVIGTIGIIGLICFERIVSGLASRFGKMRYRMYEGFTTSS